MVDFKASNLEQTCTLWSWNLNQPSANVPTANKFQTQLKAIFSEGGYFLQHVLNVDETGLFRKDSHGECTFPNQKNIALD